MGPERGPPAFRLGERESLGEKALSLFITFEGGEGSGKTTQAALLAGWLAEQRYPVVLVKEPGSTPLGQRLRPLLKGVSMTPTAELLLFAAARAELVETVIRPYLEKGRVVIADRFSDSTMAYQGYGRGLPLVMIESTNQVATHGLQPAVTFLLDMSPEVRKSRARIAQIAMPLGMAGPQEAARVDEAGQARFERETLQFHRKVRAGYRALAEQDPGRWVVLDATGSIPEIQGRIREELGRRLPPNPPPFAELLDLTDDQAPGNPKRVGAG